MALRFTSVKGVDCATKANRVGVARTQRMNGAWHLTDARTCSSAEPPSEQVARWIDEDSVALLALDAPLGWPIDLSRALLHHRAGHVIEPEAQALFTRATDRFVRDTVGQRPLDVGADRIVRTALAALRMLQEVRDAVDEPIPLAWSPVSTAWPVAIEVYPAATLKAHGLDARGYKRRESGPDRRHIQALIAQCLVNDVGLDVATAQHDVLDAVLCVIAGLDFLAGTAYPPENRRTAEREGWIWVWRADEPH